MRISDLIKLSTDNLKRRKGRTILTVLGVVIGTCSIVMMMSIGEAIDKSTEDMMQGMGDLTQVTVYNWRSEEEQEPLTDSVIAQMGAMEHVKVATPLFQSNYIGSATIFGGKNDKYQINCWIGEGSDIIGMNVEAIKEYGYELIEGRYAEEKDKAFTVIAGQNVDYQFYNPKREWPNNRVEPVPDENGVMPKPFVNVYKDKITLSVKSYEENAKEVKKNIKVVGKVKEDWNKGYETYGGFIMNIDDLIALEEEYIKVNKIRVEDKNKERSYSQAVLKVDDIENVEEVLAAIEEMGYDYSSPTSYIKELKKSTQTIQLILAGLGSISLLVAAISIANTMTMAIYERRREIGIMKVLGCEIKNIRAMFLVESAGIGFLGGVAGVAISYLLSFVLNIIATNMMGPSYDMYGNIIEGAKTYVSIIPLWLALAGIGFSSLVGMLSGYIPANKAVKISALTAIKND
ncbi:MAG: ABC transporter permease [Oscillospiraceae bacterium]|nr:ABC transporter permease [Oscillospiraceae bacterium]